MRKWAIRTARSLGKVDRDDFYDLQDVFSCMFKVIELDLFLNSDIYSSSVMEEGKLILLPPHLYDSTNYKDYWLGEVFLCTSSVLNVFYIYTVLQNVLILELEGVGMTKILLI